ncbi:Protein EARLY FLOWERING 3 [Apostasia shenzhenica]|uniref:Protein EARLY FLOWERING 3 n=1 Tax=Apostasia shenzhenica TaxID=1088818 RepID=A0A2I0AJF5_9ASPA|nr:Protein EARLY FLOWERING 3 [Apostasia shenzhenica]
MKRGKEDDKAVRPMFPRLHVNDADRGGPRAPPRNKMALYEQLSIPSQRFNPTALPPPNPGTLAPSASSSKGGTHERTVLSPFYPPKSMPTQSAEKACSRSPDGKYVNTMGMELERSFCRVDNKYSRSAGSIAVGSSLSAHDQSCGKKFCKKKLDDDDDDDFRVPTFNQVGSIQQFKEANLVDLSKSAPLGPSILQKTSSSRLNSSIQVPSSDGKPVDEANASEILSKANNRNHDEQRSTEPLVENDHNSPTYPEADVMHADNSKVLLLASDVGVQTKMVKTNYLNSQIHGESTDKGALDGRGCINKAEILEKMNSSWIRSQSCSRESLEHIHGSNVNAENWPGLLNNSDKSDEISETSMVDSISGLEISPDDVVGIIGPKQFWKARRAIVK